jgi:ferritin
MDISNKTLSLIQKQISIENSNHLIYVELADWCNYNSYLEAEKFFLRQAKDELKHRDKFRTFLLDMDKQVAPFTLEKFDYGSINSLEDCVYAGLAVEKSTTKEITRIREAAMSNGDHEACVMIQWFVTEQIEEEMLFNTAIRWIENNNMIKAPDWYIGTLRNELNEFLGEMLE